MTSSKLAFGLLALILLFSSVVFAHSVLRPRVFNVKNYGAIADGKTDNSMAFMRAWVDACHWGGGGRVLVPLGEYRLSNVKFSGPCHGRMTFLIKGVLKAPTFPAIFTGAWVIFQYVDELTIKGGGMLDGQGAYAWPDSDCKVRRPCLPLPANLGLEFVTDSRMDDIRSINSKNVHVSLFACTNLNISRIRIRAPENSPNTDGIKIGDSKNIRISHAHIATGDDCIAMVAGSHGIDISDVSCGPGHGISVGSLGRSPKEYVSGINVWNSSFYGTQNGVRIKTWSPSLAGGVSDVTFADIYMENVNNPIFIDQDYCPSPPCRSQSVSQVKISGVTYKNIWGTSSSKAAVSLHCSKLVHCSRVQLVDINLVNRGPTGPATASCSNVNGKSYGLQVPPGCL